MSKIKHLENKFSIASYELILSCEPLELKFYLWLKLWAINKKSAFPSMETICVDIGITKPTLISLINKMEQKGRLKIERKHRNNNIYDITWYDNIAYAWVKILYPTGKKTLPNKVKKLYSNEYKETNRNNDIDLSKLTDWQLRRLVQ